MKRTALFQLLLLILLVSPSYGAEPTGETVLNAATDTMVRILSSVNEATVAPHPCSGCIVKPILVAKADEGAGSGGGGSKAEARIMARFWEVLARVDRLNLDGEMKNLVQAIKNNLKHNSPQIEVTPTLTYCDSKKPISEIKDAWGCPGRLQLLPTFDESDDALIFHELTRITPGYAHVDDGMRVSTGKLALNVRQKKTFMIEEIFPKSKFSKDDIKKRLEALKIAEGAGAGIKAFGVEEDKDDYVITTVWRVILPDGTKTQDDGTFQWRQ